MGSIDAYQSTNRPITNQQLRLKKDKESSEKLGLFYINVGGLHGLFEAPTDWLHRHRDGHSDDVDARWRVNVFVLVLRLSPVLLLAAARTASRADVAGNVRAAEATVGAELGPIARAFAARAVAAVAASAVAIAAPAVTVAVAHRRREGKHANPEMGSAVVFSHGLPRFSALECSDSVAADWLSPYLP